MGRKYNFELPYKISYFYVVMGLQGLKDEGIFERLPIHVRNGIEDAYNSWSGVVVTKEDCDSIDEETWEIIANRLNLSWESTKKNK